MMGPAGLQGKRKRGDRTYSHDSADGQRPSPHRPENLPLAHHSYSSPQQYGRGYHHDGASPGRGRGRGGRGGRGVARSPVNNSYGNHSHYNFRPTSSGSPTNPPAARVESQSQPAPQPEAKPPNAPLATVSTQTPPAPIQNAHYPYDYVTKEARGSWKDGGRQSVVDSGVKARDIEDAINLAIIYQEIIRAGLDGHLDPEEAGSVVKTILEAEATGNLAEESLIPFDAPSLFLDTLSILPPDDAKNARFKPLVFSTRIPATTMREILDSTMLVQLGLVRDTFERKAIRYATNALYRQSNYNLLREETEGYSKLVTELFTTSSNEPPSPEVVTGTFERVKALIGTFDLDVGRVLDISLDVFAAILVKHYRFVVKYLRVSSWWPQASSTRGGVEGAGFYSLPKWAAPGEHGSRPLNEDEKQALLESRDHRDSAFWARVREVGLKAFFELGGRQASAAEIQAAAERGEDELNSDQEWIEKTGSLPPPGNKVAAQILGFKLRFYSSSARDSSDVLPHNLLALAALLIKIGFISLADLYPHLWPEDDGMASVKEQKLKEKEERERLRRPGGGAMNALLMAGALPDDMAPTSSANRAKEAEAAKTAASAEAKAKEEKPGDGKEGASNVPEPADQKVTLLKCLLCIGAIPDSLYMLGRFPWLLEAVPELPEYLHRLFHFSLHKIYDPIQPLHDHPETREPEQMVDLDQSGVTKGTVRRTSQPPRRILRWAQLDKSDPSEETEYRFYWDDWADNVPVCQTMDDVFSLCDTLLNLSGFKIGQDPALLAKLARIGIHSIEVDSSEANRLRWIRLTKRLLVPALSVTRHNSGTVGEVWLLLKRFPITVRYNIYAEWFTGQTSRLPDLKAAFDLSRAETKDVLKRISKKNTKQMARALAKIATSSPGVVFNVALNQIESYDNLSEVIVDCARYFTDLGYDVLTWSVMNALGARGRNRVQADGMLTSKWLAALAAFSGNVFKRYSIMNPTPILQYVAEQLRKGNPTDLIVLEQIIFSMAGIVSDATFNDTQVICMGGGPLLKTQTMLQLLDRRNEPGMPNSSKRLMRALVGPKLAGQLLISIAQARETCAFSIPDEDAHLKLLGNLFDEIHRVLTQYLDLLRSNLSIKEFNALIPDLASLIGDFGVDPSIAFWISRQSITHEIAEYDKVAAAEKKQASQAESSSPSKAQSQDVEMADKPTSGEEAKENPDDAATEVTQATAKTSEDVEMKGSSSVEMDISSSPTEASQEKPSESAYPWHPVLRSTMDSLRPALPEDTWKHLSESFYITFWQLSIGDMLVPTSSYTDERERVSRRMTAITNDKSDQSTIGLRYKDQKKAVLQDLLDHLTAELKDQISAYSQSRARLQKEKDFWFSNDGNWEAIPMALLERCFVPRLRLSAVDALYTFRMFKLLHSHATKNFRTIKVMDAIFDTKWLAALVFHFTAKEAENFGRFMNELLKCLASWHADQQVYEREAYGAKKDLKGFYRNPEDPSPLAYEDFRRQLSKWHLQLKLALEKCFTSGEYMHIRNAVIVLKSVVAVFPMVNFHGEQLVSCVDDISKTDSRDDLKLAAMSLLGNLKRRQKEWVMVQAFNSVWCSPKMCRRDLTNEQSKFQAGSTGGPKSATPKPSTPQPSPSTEKKSLNAQAPDFKPRTTPAK